MTVYHKFCSFVGICYSIRVILCNCIFRVGSVSDSEVVRVVIWNQFDMLDSGG